MFVYTIKDIIGVGALAILVVGFVVLWSAEKFMFWLERKNIISDRWRNKP